jgi:hypothetical protein
MLAARKPGFRDISWTPPSHRASRIPPPGLNVNTNITVR